MVKLTENEILNTRGYHAAETVLLNGMETYRHTHEFYELFITKEGDMYHCCNHQRNLLPQNTLCLVKPEDIHSFQKGQCKSVCFMNLAFSKEHFEKGLSIWQQFYGGNIRETGNCASLPGSLSQAMISRILYLMKHMTDAGEIPWENLVLGILLDALTCLQNFKTTREAIPGWLERTCYEMRKRENYMYGINRFVEISGKSQEHLNRMMKRYYGKTPTEYVNTIRLEQAAFFLRTTDESVLNIMLDCGFNNVSYFNKRFKDEFGVTPTRYRQFNRLVVNPVSCAPAG